MIMQKKIYIKGMVCNRCISAVKDSLAELGIEVVDIHLGEVTIIGGESINEALIGEKLKSLGFNILEDKKLKLVREVKKLVEEVYSGSFDFPYQFRFSNLVAERLNTSYDVISGIFSGIEQITIETYIINYRIEKIKEFLVYSGDSLASISFKLGFTSAAHLSRQFKLNTGLNPSHFRQIRLEKTLPKRLNRR